MAEDEFREYLKAGIERARGAATHKHKHKTNSASTRFREYTMVFKTLDYTVSVQPVRRVRAVLALS